MIMYPWKFQALNQIVLVFSFSQCSFELFCTSIKTVVGNDSLKKVMHCIINVFQY